MKRFLLAAALSASGLVAGAQNLFLEDTFYEPFVVGLTMPTAFEFVGHGMILVNQKVSGEVLVLQKDEIVGVALDLSVANVNEMGLLGIVKHPDFESNHLIYLFYTYAEQDGGTLIEDRLETYTWDPVLKTLSFDARIATWGDDGWQFSPYHHGGYIKVGPDRKLYVQRGDMRRYGTLETNDTKGVSGSNAAIYRIELDGSVPQDNPFVNSPTLNFQRAFVYGVRNAFGMAFDPISGKLWYTENGPEIYDEINIAEPGMNSGWKKIMGPDSRDANMAINNGLTYDEKDLYMIDGAHYSDPVFSYFTTIGITCLEFLWNSKLPENLRSKAIISCTSLGRLFLLPISPSRTGLVLGHDLADKVADTEEERDRFMVGNGWGAVTDARVGPDGYLYLSAFARGTIYRIRPIREQLHPTWIAVERGTTAGGLDELARSDDEYLSVRPGVTLTTADPQAVIKVAARSPFLQLDNFTFELEMAGSSPALSAEIYLYNFVDSKYDFMATVQLETTDGHFKVEVLEKATAYVDPKTNDLRAQLAFRQTGPMLAFPWAARLDQISWNLERKAP